MKPWFQLTLVTSTVGGGFAGFSATLQHLLRFEGRQSADYILMIVFLVVYAFITVSGLLFVRDPHRIVPLLIASSIQIPWFSSPLFAYRLTAGFHVTVGLIEGKFGGGFSLGSEWQCNVLQKLPSVVGVNIFALVIVILLAVELCRRT